MLILSIENFSESENVGADCRINTKILKYSNIPKTKTVHEKIHSEQSGY